MINDIVFTCYGINMPYQEKNLFCWYSWSPTPKHQHNRILLISETALSVMWPIVWGLTRERMCTKYKDYDIQFCFCKSDRSVGERKVHGVILVMTQELKFRPFYSEITWKIAVILVCFHSNPMQCYAYIGNPLQTI